MVKIKLYNTASRKKEEFKPIKKGEVGIYSCGPTVYSSPHIGNMYAYVCWDVLVKSLEYLGFEVKQVMNITDVGELSSSGEDKMEGGAKKESLSVWKIAEKYENEFFESCQALNILKPNVVCRATEYIKEQIDLIKKIEKNGYTYQIDDGIYFDTSKFSDYAKFANLNLSELIDTDRDEISKQKINKSDFALWKFSPKDRKKDMEWESPWGKGFPGWHIECSAMSISNLGEAFDIHTGGIDHIPVHHTNEIAQGYGAFGKQTANYWIHNGFLTIKGEKISKSTGGLYTIRQLTERGVDSLAYRMMVISSHYRKGLEFSLESLRASEIALSKLRSFMEKWREEGSVNKKYKNLFMERLANDMAMPEVMALVWKLTKDNTVDDADKKATLLDFDKVLGLNLNKRIKVEIPKEVTDLAKERIKAKMDKNWQKADTIRQAIEDKGFVVEDLPKNSYRIVVKR